MDDDDPKVGSGQDKIIELNILYFFHNIEQRWTGTTRETSLTGSLLISPLRSWDPSEWGRWNEIICSFKSKCKQTKRLTKCATQALTGKRVLSLWRISSRSRGRRQLWRNCRWIAGIIRALGRANNSIKYSVNLAGHPVFPREEGEIQGRTIGIYPEIKSAAATNMILADRGDPLRFKLQFKIYSGFYHWVQNCHSVWSPCAVAGGDG